MEDIKFYEQRILSLLEATPSELCARLKQRLNQSLVREGYPPFSIRDHGCRKFSEFLIVRLGDRLSLEWPTSSGDIVVSLKTAGDTQSPPVPASRDKPSGVRTDVWQAFTNPDLKRKRYFNRIDHRILHFIEDVEDEYSAKWKDSPNDYVEIDVLTGDVQVAWIRDFIALLNDSELDPNTVGELLSGSYSTGVNTTFTKLLGARAEEWRKIRTHKIGEHIASWATRNNIHMHELRPKAQHGTGMTEAEAPPAPAPAMTIREQAIKLLERMSEDEIARVAIPVLLGNVLSNSQL